MSTNTLTSSWTTVIINNPNEYSCLIKYANSCAGNLDEGEEGYDDVYWKLPPPSTVAHYPYAMTIPTSLRDALINVTNGVILKLNL